MHAEEEERKLALNRHACRRESRSSQQSESVTKSPSRTEIPSDNDNNNKPKLLNSVSFPLFSTTFPTTTILESNKKCSSTHNCPSSLPQSENKLPTSFPSHSLVLLLLALDTAHYTAAYKINMIVKSIAIDSTHYQ
jgi:hypothetical protein